MGKMLNSKYGLEFGFERTCKGLKLLGVEGGWGGCGGGVHKGKKWEEPGPMGAVTLLPLMRSFGKKLHAHQCHADTEMTVSLGRSALHSSF